MKKTNDLLDDASPVELEWALFCIAKAAFLKALVADQDEATFFWRLVARMTAAAHEAMRARPFYEGGELRPDEHPLSRQREALMAFENAGVFAKDALHALENGRTLHRVEKTYLTPEKS